MKIDAWINSWAETENCLHTFDEIKAWILSKNQNLKVQISKIELEPDGFWYYDEGRGVIANRSNSFFQIGGFEKSYPDGTAFEQPMILQNEIGYLGIICKEINGVIHFLMQAKIEPGNVNKVQISPTIQATKSNFTQKHNGKKPAYIDFFINASYKNVLADQIQSEQSSRFYHKRNRNIIVFTEEEVEVLPSHCWMTLGQLKQLMKEDNLVNMDTRTVLSCIPYSLEQPESMKKCEEKFKDKALFKSIYPENPQNRLPEIYRYINDYKMFDESTLRQRPLYSLKDWEMKGGELICKKEHPFKIIFCDIAIEGREVKRWTQPLLEAQGMALFGLLTCVKDGVRMFLANAKAEIGCFDGMELGPTVQMEPTDKEDVLNPAQKLLLDKARNKSGVLYDVVLSEEGGRFYHEQNRNLIVEIPYDELPEPSKGMFWLDYRTLNQLIQVNNCVNIQLRNLLSLLEV